MLVAAGDYCPADQHLALEGLVEAVQVRLEPVVLVGAEAVQPLLTVVIVVALALL